MLLEVGTIVKTHGLRGDVVVTFTSERPERREVGAAFDTDVGEMTIRSARPHQGKWIIDFGLTNREDADRLRGVVLRAEAIEDPAEVWIHELIGAEVVDQSETRRGKVTDVLANPASDLMVLEGGALVPLTFMSGGVDEGLIRVDVPDGLFELYEG